MLIDKGYTKLKNKAEKIVESVKASKILSNKEEYRLSYVYPCENYIDGILSNGVVRKTLQVFADKYCKDQIQNVKSSGQLVSKSNYPRFYDILQSCYKSLNVADIPEVYITNQLKGINALSVGTDNAPIVLISCKAVISLSDGELKFMIGHELGHILQKNLMCHTLKGVLDNLNNKTDIVGPMVSDLIEVPLNQWYRCSEYTADRAGLICCQNLDDVKFLFAKLSFPNKTNKLNDYYELSKIHPLMSKRINMLSQFMFTIT